jgi:chromosome segregation ATPase
MERPNGFDRGRTGEQATQIVVISLCFLMLAGCGQRLQRLESNQIIVEEKVDANRHHLEIMAHKMEKSQGELQAGIEKMEQSQWLLQAAIEEVKQGNEITLAEAIATRYEQRKLREASEANDDMIRGDVSKVGVRQQILKQSIGQVDFQAKEIRAEVEALASDQQSLRKRISNDHQRVAADLGAVQENQKKTHGMSEKALARTQTIAQGVTGIQQGQKSLSGEVKAEGQQLRAQIKGVAQNQKEMRDALSETHGVSLVIANNVGQLQGGQSDQHKLLQTRTSSLDAKVTGVQRKQEALASGIQENRELAHAIVENVSQVQAQQETLHELIQGKAEVLSDTLNEVGSKQSRVGAGLQENIEIANDIKGDLKRMQQDHKQIQEQVQHDSKKIQDAMNGINTKQQKLLKGVDGVHAAVNSNVSQTAALRNGQARLNQSMQENHGQVTREVDAGMTTLDNKVSASAADLESRLAALALAMQDYKNEQAKTDTTIEKGLSSLAQALEQIKVNQMLLSRRLERTRNDAQGYNEQFKKTLEQLKQEKLKLRTAPRKRQEPAKETVEEEK